jgi:hypothetical protein
MILETGKPMKSYQKLSVISFLSFFILFLIGDIFILINEEIAKKILVVSIYIFFGFTVPTFLYPIFKFIHSLIFKK